MMTFILASILKGDFDKGIESCELLRELISLPALKPEVVHVCKEVIVLGTTSKMC